MENIKPSIRFPEFTENWEPNILGNPEFTSFLKGKGISKADIVENGQTECIRYGELYTLYDEIIDNVYSKTNIPTGELVLSKANDVIIPASGETRIDIATASCVLRDNIALSGDLNIIRSTINGIFLSYYLNNKKKKAIASFAQGSSVIHLYNPHLRKLKLNIPKPTEQQKIATFLTEVDNRITLLKEKKDALVDYKKGVMQKLFKQEIRFKDDDGNDFPVWEEKMLGEVLDYEQPTKYIVESIEYDNSFETPVLTAGKSFLLGYSDETENIFTDVPVIIFDDFTMANQFVTFPFKVKSSAMKILKNDVTKANIVFVYAAMEMIYYPKGDEHKRFWISEYSKIEIPFPKLEEQTKIANYLTTLDNKIDGLQQKIEESVEFKKGLLQKMFV
jgi:type I restriction enzyme S subunit